MNKPTQAQIEAAAKAIHAYELSAGELENEWEHKWQSLPSYFEKAEAALTSAAQVGESKLVGLSPLETELIDTIKILRAEAAATIERCAQVADKLVRETIQDTMAAAESNCARHIAAAIRKLKGE